MDHVFTKFIDAFIKEMIDALLQLKLWFVFDIFDPRKFLQSVTEMPSYGNREITVLIHTMVKKKQSHINLLL